MLQILFHKLCKLYVYHDEYTDVQKAKIYVGEISKNKHLKSCTYKVQQNTVNLCSLIFLTKLISLNLYSFAILFFILTYNVLKNIYQH